MNSTFVSAIPLRRIHVSTPPSICMTKKPADESSHPKPESSPSPKPTRSRKKTIRSNATFKNEFLPEFGVKGPGSRPNWDLRPKSLRTDDENPDVCDACDGSGRTICSFCLGTDFQNADGSFTTCPACDGKHLVTCSACFGTKKNIELVSYACDSYQTIHLHTTDFLLRVLLTGGKLVGKRCSGLVQIINHAVWSQAVCLFLSVLALITFAVERLFGEPVRAVNLAENPLSPFVT